MSYVLCLNPNELTKGGPLHLYLLVLIHFIFNSQLGPPRSNLSGCLSFLVFGVSQVDLTDGKRVGGGRGANSQDGEKAWPSINHLILSATEYLPC